MKNLFEKEELEKKKLFDSRDISDPQTPDGKAMRAVFDNELEKKEKETLVKNQVVTPGPKAMKSVFEPEEVHQQKVFDGRLTSELSTPDSKV
jgi:hypothetical protein